VNLRHLGPYVWEHATRRIVAKMIGEFSHEWLIRAEASDHAADGYELLADEPHTRYRFTARCFGLDHWEVDPASIRRIQVSSGNELELDALEFTLDFCASLGLVGEALSLYLEELAASLYAEAYKADNQRHDARALVHASFQAIETAMTAGHPCFIVNAGRLGFDVDDHARFAPEAGRPLRLIWLAATRERAQFNALDGIDYAEFIAAELGSKTCDRFDARLRASGLDPSEYLLMPAHPWQWRNRLCAGLAAEIARNHIVELGESEDEYQPQQSIRTVFNVSDPRRCYVKTALSIINMGFVRGLSPYYMQATPAINQWVDDLVRSDATLRACNFEILRELATVGYRCPSYERAGPRTSPLNKLFAALWRESPVTRADPGEQLMTMAALLHRDRDGRSLLAELLAAHGLDPAAWLRAYLHVYLRPILRCYYAHELAFMPHGENVILGLRDGLPVRAFIKDIAEEVLVFKPASSLPEEVRRIAVDFPVDRRPLHILMDVFDCFFRFLAPIFATQCGLPETEFWRAVADCIHRYQAEHPAHAALYRRDDLFAPRFALSCVNRMQLHDSRQLLDLTNPAASLQIHGSLQNPLAPFAEGQA
jgi:siderophore synthetase component